MKAKILSILSTLILLTACTPTTVTPPAAQQVPANPTLTPIPPTETAVPPTSTPDLFAQATAISFSGDGSIDVYLLPESDGSVKFATEMGREWKTAKPGEYLQIEGFKYKWIPESLSLERVYSHWSECEAGITEEAVNAQYGALVEETKNIWSSYEIGQALRSEFDKDGKKVTWSLVDGFPEWNQKSFPTVNGMIFDKTLCLVNVNGNEFQVAVGYMPTREGSGWKKVATPVSVLTPDGLFVPFFRSGRKADSKSGVFDYGTQNVLAMTWKGYQDTEYVNVSPSGLLLFGDNNQGELDFDEDFYKRYITYFNQFFDTDDPYFKDLFESWALIGYNIKQTHEDFDAGIDIMVNTMQAGVEGKNLDENKQSKYDFALENSPIGVWLHIDF